MDVERLVGSYETVFPCLATGAGMNNPRIGCASQSSLGLMSNISQIEKGSRQHILAPMSILQELQWRGLLADCTSEEELAMRFSKGPIVLYCGFDPTAHSLHVAAWFRADATRFQLLGHHPIALAGGATGCNWGSERKDPGAPVAYTRNLDANVAGVKNQLKKLWISKPRQIPPVYWIILPDRTYEFSRFLREIGKHFSVNQMVAKESVRARMEDREAGISYTEFSYMLLQAFDFMCWRAITIVNCKSAGRING